MFPVPARRIPQPSLLRSHPRPRSASHACGRWGAEMLPPIEVVEEPMVSLVGMGPGAMRPRYRFPGVWF